MRALHRVVSIFDSSLNHRMTKSRENIRNLSRNRRLKVLLTKHGNARIFSDWNDFEPFRSALLEKCKPSRGRGYEVNSAI